MRAVPQKIRSGLVELRTKTGLLYVSPSVLERIYLLWTFRNFHRLPKEVLNSRQRQLIEKLCRTALVKQTSPVTTASLIGSVENIEVFAERKKETAVRSDNIVTMKAGGASEVVLRAVGSEVTPTSRTVDRKSSAAVQPISALKPESKRSEANDKAGSLSGRRIHVREWQFGALFACCGMLLVAGLLYVHSRRPLSSAPRVVTQDELPATSSVASVHRQNPQPPTPLPSQPQPKMVSAEQVTATLPASPHVIRKPEVSVSSQAALRTVDAGEIKRLQITELPEDGFTYPVAPSANLTGTVRLKAVIGPDGKVSQIDVLSGNRALAHAAMQAVRQWRYRTHEVHGSAVEAETTIVISFQGDDAVSISLPPGQ